MPPHGPDAPATGPSLFVGASEMAARMRSHDWASSPLGEPAGWPATLRGAVRMVLTSRHAMWLGWGHALTFFYNDAYAPTLGIKQSRALGASARDVWSEIWPTIGPRIDLVQRTGEATWDEGLMLVLERSGFPEETYHTFSYSPLLDDDGATRGMLCVVTEETERILGERRLSLLRDLAARLAATHSVDEVYTAVECCLAGDARDIPFSLAWHFDDKRRAVLRARTGLAEGHPSAPAAIELDAHESPWPLANALARGAPAAVTPLAPHLTWPGGPWDTPARHALVVPIAQRGSKPPAGVFIAGLDPYRPLDAAYRDFVGLFVGQIAAGLANARAYEAERRRAEALAEVDRAKTAFFSNVSHEFRTPLTLMLGPLSDLTGRDDLPTDTRVQLALVHRNGQRLLRLVNTMLDFSRIEAGRGRASYEPIDLSSYTADLASVFRSATERAGLRLVVDCPPLDAPVYVDREMWEKVVLNLVSNAFKFTHEGEIAVTVRRDGDRARIVVRDTGGGIPEAELPRVFERFHRIEGSRSRTHEGTGIGLALVLELVKLHGGAVRVESEVGRGSAFTVSIPMGRAHLPPEHVREAPAPVPPRGSNAFVEAALRWLPDDAPGELPLDPEEPGADDARECVLLADDNADMRNYIRRLLGARWRVTAVANGAEALRRVARARPNLVITDVMMPDLDGFGLLQALRADPETRDLPVLMLTARAGEESRVVGLQAGADDYLVKPFSARELEVRVEALLLRARMRGEVARARREAELANRAKDEFLAMLGHELRNPLAPILTALQLMHLRGVEGATRERAIIERQVKHLVGLVDDLLDVSRITRGKVQLKRARVEVADVLARAVEMASPLLEQHRHALVVDVAREGLCVDADPGRLAQVLSNLLTNAAKYSKAGGRITVSAGVEGAHVAVRVRDTGMGIEREMLPRVFELFAQERQALDRSQGGLGLGLAIVRSLVELHGGAVSAASEGRGMGAEFTVRLPRVASPEAREAPSQESPAAPARAAAGQRVLVVDDNEDAAVLLADALAQWGYTTRVAHDGPSALREAEGFDPDVAVLDLGLPVMDGYELARRIAAHPQHRRARLVALTGYGQDLDRARSAAAGFLAHLVKPVDFDQLRATLARFT